MKGPKSYDSTETLVLYILYSLYDLSNNLFQRKCISKKLVSMCYVFYVLCHRSIELSPKMRVGGLYIILLFLYLWKNKLVYML
jgi:hypothetical protein